MFLIPVIPGAPIYLCCGVTIVAAGEKHFGSFVTACAWAIFVAFLCKLSGILAHPILPSYHDYPFQAMIVQNPHYPF